MKIALIDKDSVFFFLISTGEEELMTDKIILIPFSFIYLNPIRIPIDTNKLITTKTR